MRGEKLNHGVVSLRRGGVQRGVARLVRRVHIGAKRDGGGDRFEHAAFRLDFSEINHRNAAATRVLLRRKSVLAMQPNEQLVAEPERRGV